MAHAAPSTIYKYIKTQLQTAAITQLGGVVEDAMLNPMKNTADWTARFPMRLYIFGDQQMDGAGETDGVMFFAILARMKLDEEMSDKEYDFLDLNDLIKTTLHRRQLAENCIIMWQKSVFFYDSMTLTNESRRITVKLNDGEVGLMVFFSGMCVRLVALTDASDAVRATGSETVEGTGDAAATEGELALAEKGLTIMQQLF